MAINQKTKKRIGMVVIFVVVMVAAVFLVNGKMLDRLQLQVSSLLYQTRESKTPIVIVGVDQQTTNLMDPTATWTRDNYVKAIKNISKYNPAVIGLDYYFASTSKVIPIKKLTEILSDNQSSPDVVSKLNQLTGSGELNQFDQELADEIKNNTKLVMINPPTGTFNASYLINGTYKATLPNPAFMPVQSARMGSNQNLQEEDGSWRKYVPMIRGVEDYPSFAMAIISTYFGAQQMQIVNYSPTGMEVSLAGKKLEIPLDNYQFLINFAEKNLHADDLKAANAANKNFKYLRFLDVFNDNFADINTADIAGKIVLIGPYVQNNDTYKVPIDSDYRMAGVQVHAEAIQTILDQAWLREMGFVEEIAVIALMVVLGLLIIFNSRIILALIAVVLIGALYTAVIGPWAFRNGLIINLIYPPVALVMTAIIGYAYRYLTEFRQKTVVADALGRFVNKGIAAKVLDEGKIVKIGTEKHEITVVFSDIKGFTTISEGLQPQSLVALLNEYFEIMSNIITKHGGTVDKFVGDAIMALFGAPVAMSDHAAKACAAALEMREALPGLLEKWKGQTLPGGEPYPIVDFRVGVSTGTAVIGNIGSAEHLSYTAMGDIVNLGSRLESANKKYETHIMISEPTFEAVADKFECRYMDKIRVKGKGKGVMVYELICPHGELGADRFELISLYNKAIGLYYERKFIEALRILEGEILVRWPKDSLSNIYAGRCEVLKRYPPTADWDFIYTMENK